MRPGLQGNGSGKFNITVADMGGWVRVFAKKGEETGREDLGVYLSQSLTNWFRSNPRLHMKCLVPIIEDGATVELHAWYEIHVLQPTAAGPQPEAPREE